MGPIKELHCKSAIGKCGFPGGGYAINPYIGCEHDCKYCYARFMRRFTNHKEEWGAFVDAKINIDEVLEKQILKYKKVHIYLGTVTDPYQPAEKKYKLSRKILKILSKTDNSISILTKSSLVLRDLDIIKKFKDIDINFTINTLDEKWREHIEPNAPTIKERLEAIKKLTDNNIKVYAMMGPYWPIFTDTEALFKAFKQVGVSKVFSESFNTVGGNFTGVEKVLKQHYPDKLEEMKSTLNDKEKFFTFYTKAEKQIKQLSKQYKIPVELFFGLGHTKFATYKS